MITTADQLKSLGTILFVGAHPDDETFNSGGLLAAAAKNGQKVVVVTATRGEGGVKDKSRWPQAQLGAIRTKEMAKALEILGCQDNYWLDYPDGGCAEVLQQEAVAQIKTVIQKHQPDTIISFGPDGMTGHPDHQTVSTWALAAAEPNQKVYRVVLLPETYENMRPADKLLNFFFRTSQPPIEKPANCDIVLRLEGDLLVKKYQALKAHASQYPDLFAEFSQADIYKMFQLEAYCLVK